jgi:hypothetical protein
MLVLGVLIISNVIYGQTFWGGETMSSQKVKQKWGSEKYNAEVFKAGTYLDKSKMAYSIMTDKTLLEQPYEKIRELFGEFAITFHFCPTELVFLLDIPSKNTRHV